MKLIMILTILFISSTTIALAIDPQTLIGKSFAGTTPEGTSCTFSIDSYLHYGNDDIKGYVTTISADNQDDIRQGHGYKSNYKYPENLPQTTIFAENFLTSLKKVPPQNEERLTIFWPNDIETRVIVNFYFNDGRLIQVKAKKWQFMTPEQSYRNKIICNF